MPLPQPKGEELRADFIERCMGDPTAISEYPDKEQRAAICIKQFGGEKQPATNDRMNDLKKHDGPIRVNIRAQVNNELIRREQRDGRDVVVVKSATLPDDIIMNGILYPKEEIEAGYKSLEGSPAPLGHPMVNGMFVSARTPLGLNIGYFGAWNANAHQHSGRVMLEKVIDIERANESKMGRRVMAAIEQGKPIHTSTGLTMNLRDCERSDLAEMEGYNMEFDHDAILLDEDGAATPEQGVGMLINSDGQKSLVINSDIEERMDEHIDMLGMELLAAMDRKESASKWEQIKSAIMEALGLARAEISIERKEAMNMAEKEEDGGMGKMNARMDKIEERIGNMEEKISNMGKETKEANALVAEINAERAAAKSALVNQAVEAELLTKEDAEATPAKALEVMLNAAKKREAPKPAPGIFGGFANTGSAPTSLAEDWEKEA